MESFTIILRRTAVLSFLFILFSCAAGVSQRSGNTGYKEDLSSYRPKPPADTVTIEEANNSIYDLKNEPIKAAGDVTAELDKKLTEISKNTPTKAKGYRINIYTGTNREQAELKKKEAEVITDGKVYLQFKAPNFRVKVGNAINRLEANYLLGKLKDEFPGAVIVPDDIEINTKQ